jgi:hypothetical protein
MKIKKYFLQFLFILAHSNIYPIENSKKSFLQSIASLSIKEKITYASLCTLFSILLGIIIYKKYKKKTKYKNR